MFTPRRIFWTLACLALIGSTTSFLRPVRLAAAPEPMVLVKEISDAYGMEVQENTAGRVVVSRIIPDSPAEGAEVKVGDVIVGVDTASVLSIKGLVKYL